MYLTGNGNYIYIISLPHLRFHSTKHYQLDIRNKTISVTSSNVISTVFNRRLMDGDYSNNNGVLLDTDTRNGKTFVDVRDNTLQKYFLALMVDSKEIDKEDRTNDKLKSRETELNTNGKRQRANTMETGKIPLSWISRETQ